MAATHDEFHDSHAAGADDAFLAMLRLRGDRDVLNQDAGRALDVRLAADPSLQAEAQALAGIDAMLREHAGRQAGPEVTQAMSDRALQASLRLMREQALLRRQHAANHHRRVLASMPKWAWGSAVAAAVAVGLVLWAVNTDPSSNLVGSKDAPSDVTDNTWFLESPFGSIPSYTFNDPSDGNAAEIEQQFDALRMIAEMSDADAMSADESTDETLD